MAVKGRRKATNQRRVMIVRITEEQVFALGVTMAMQKSVGVATYWATALNPLTDVQRANIGNNPYF